MHILSSQRWKWIQCGSAHTFQWYWWVSILFDSFVSALDFYVVVGDRHILSVAWAGRHTVQRVWNSYISNQVSIQPWFKEPNEDWRLLLDWSLKFWWCYYENHHNHHWTYVNSIHSFRIGYNEEYHHFSDMYMMFGRLTFTSECTKCEKCPKWAVLETKIATGKITFPLTI